MIPLRELADIVETLVNAKKRGTKCCLLIGAGCSVDAGIPTANGFVKRIENDYPRSYAKASPKSYPQCMAQLTVSERRALIAEYVDRAKVNWVHICVGLLLQAGYVDRVLTTNFDSLIVRACSLLNEFPAIYDFAASQLFKPADIADRAVFYLHGQRSGFVLMNTLDECSKHSELLRRVFEDAGRGRIWIVVGYSGTNDPVFDHLAAVNCFDSGLYWIGHLDNEPSKHLRDQLLVPGKQAYFVPKHDAHSFFVGLTQALGIFPPKFVTHPFSHLEAVFETLVPFTVPSPPIAPPSSSVPLPSTNPGAGNEIDVMRGAREWIAKAKRRHEQSESVLLGDGDGGDARRDQAEALTLDAIRMLMSGDYEGVLRAADEHPSVIAQGSVGVLVREAYLARARQAVANAKAAVEKGRTDRADKYFTDACNDIEAAFAVRPGSPDVLTSWGYTLLEHARTKLGSEADRLYSAAAEKYRAALVIQASNDQALNNLGAILFEQAKHKTGAAADRLFEEAAEKFQAAVTIKPDKHEALYNWGNALMEQALAKGGETADRLFIAAGEKFRAALAIKPDKFTALYNWGNALLKQAESKTGNEANELLAAASDKFRAAYAIKPGRPEILNNWGISLGRQAHYRTGDEARRLLVEACDKFEMTLALDNKDHEALTNWGHSLYQLAQVAEKDEVDHLLGAAADKLQAAAAVQPTESDTQKRWGVVLMEQGKRTTGKDADALFSAAGDKFRGVLVNKPDDIEALNNWASTLIMRAGLHREYDVKIEYLRFAEDLMIKVEQMEPGLGAYNLACISCARGDEQECKLWLERSKVAGHLPAKEILLFEPDLRAVRDTAWFKAFVASAYLNN